MDHHRRFENGKDVDRFAYDLVIFAAAQQYSTMVSPNELYSSPNALAPEYSRFRVSERLLLTGHSHQAWPDCAFEAQARAWLDAAEHVDDKWSIAFAKGDAVRRGFARLLDDPDGHMALGVSTHELVVRFLSALPLRRRPRLVTTDGEFHSIRRQLDRIAEERIEVVKVPASPARDLAERLGRAVDGRTAAALVSSVLFQTAEIVPNLRAAMEACARHGAELLVDSYHHLDVVPFSIVSEGLQRAFVVGGGYKYCQLGEGNCFLRFPKDCKLRPVVTGWFSEFESLEATHPDGRVAYGEGPARFAGATYDPASHYRAAEVLAFFERMGLAPKLLREVSQHQVALLTERFDALDLDPRVITRDRSIPLASIGGFLVLRSRRAAQICRELRVREMLSDFRGDALRLGPAPYLSDAQLDEAIRRLAEVCGIV